MSALDERIRNEIEHGRRIAADAAHVWGWTGLVGQRRWRRRVALLSQGLRPGMRVLELGAGTGLLSRALAKSGARVHAVDVSFELLKIASRSPVRGIDWSCANGYQLCFPAAFFDRVVGMSVLHHLELDRALDEIKRVLRPDGVFRFSEPNLLNPHIFAERTLLRRYFDNSPDETAFVRPLLQRKLRDHGFVDLIVRPFDFLYPMTPHPLVDWVERLSLRLETVPLLREIAGSLYIEGRRGSTAGR